MKRTLTKRVESIEYRLGKWEYIVGQLNAKPSTAMRSTGELSLCAYCMCMTKTINEYCGKCNAPKCVEPQEYCECKDRSISGGVCSICHKPIKSQEDILECDKCPHEYCVCADPDIGRNCSRCSACGLEESPIKPKEDVKEKLKNYLTNNVGLNNNIEYIVFRILAIVKGE